FHEVRFASTAVYLYPSSSLSSE
ncbi:hypothetical protein A2U01_0096515, partial [Trifolium medium]|nr:hypothetical protein [Trifolium medium]